jgi:type I restriction enzyme S subunit
MSWKKIRLGDLVEITHGWAFKSEHFSTSLSELPVVVGIGNFRYEGGFRFTETQVKRYCAEYPAEYELTPGDILLAMTCQTSGGEILGIPGKIPNDGQIYLHNQRLGKVIRKNGAQVCTEFLYWLFLSREFNHELCATATGTKILHTAPARIENFEFSCPPIEEQQSIAKILSSLDEKIELNRKQNRTLEAIAQALFKRWFVEFEFPDQNGQPYKSSGGAMQPSELGEIPMGWGGGRIGDHVEHKKDGINPGDQPEKTFHHFSIPNFDDGQDAKPELGSTILSNKYLVHEGAILVSKLNPRFPRIWPVLDLADGASVCSTEFQVLAPCEKAYGYVLSLLKSPYVASEMVLRASGTSGSHQRINPDDLLSIEVITPPHELIEMFSGIVLGCIKKQQENLNEMKVLASLRDTLLPKLLSGELRVGDAAEPAKETA